jgi:hypothetical protein
MRFLLIFFLSTTCDVTFGESFPKSFNWGLANQNPGKQFFVDEKIWEKKATNLLRGENELNVLRKFGKPIEKIQKGRFRGWKYTAVFKQKNSNDELSSIWIDFHDDRVCWVRLNK